LIGDGSIDSHAQFDLTGGTFFDEDLRITITHSNTPVPGTGQQDLVGPARIPVIRRSGPGWVLDASTNFALQAGTLYPRYNLLSGASWSSVDADTNKYIAYYIAATNHVNYPVLSIQGQDQYTNISGAVETSFVDLNLSGFPSLEFRPLYQVIFQVGAYGNSVNARIREIVDIRDFTRSATGSGQIIQDITLNDLTDVDTVSEPPEDKDTLIWSGSSEQWLPGKPALGDLSDVDTIGKIDKSVLTYDQATGKFVADDLTTVLTIADGGNF
jgi:hypothetical protein